MAQSGSTELPVDILTGQKNANGIPAIKFIENIGTFLEETNVTIEVLLQALNVMHSKYKLMEASCVENRKRLKVQIPDNEKSLSVVKMLKERQENGSDAFTTHFNLTEQVFAPASITPTGTVNLWLGANVMLEYTYNEAIELLSSNVETAKAKNAEISADIDYLKDQITTTEVNMSRTYNYDIMKRREQKRLAAIGKTEETTA